MKLVSTAADAISYPLFDLSKIKVAQGGYSIDTTILPTGLDYVKKGTLITIADSTRIAQPFKTVKVITGGNTSEPRVTKNNLFKVGDYVQVDGRAECVSITAITAGTGHDTWTLSSAITGLKAADVLIEGAVLGINTWGGTVQDVAEADTVVSVPDANFNGKVIVLAQAADDVLAVTYAANVLTITLADTTASNNTAALIQAAIRTLATTQGIDFSAATVTGDCGTGAVLTIPTKIVAANNVKTYKRTPNAIVLETVKYEGTPSITAVIAAMEMEDANLPYPITAGVMAALGSNFHFKA